MNSNDSHPKLPTWIFIVTDLALVAAAWIIASRSPTLTFGSMIAIVTCVALGALVGLVPLIVRYERQKNEMLDERQRALEALARTVGSSAEQISIAASGLHAIVEIAQKNLKAAEHLPHKLQEKIAEFHAGLSAAEDAEKEELERELLSSRTTESERLETVSQRIAKSAADWTKLEQATQQHLAAANEALAKLAMGTAAAIGKAQVAAEQALAQARVEAARTVGEASGQAVRSIEMAKVAALADIGAKSAGTAAVEEQRATPTQEDSAPASSSSSMSASADVPEAASTPPAPSVPTTRPAARIRKTRREDAPADASVAVPHTSDDASDSRSVAEDEPTPVPSARIEEVAPVAPHTADPFAPHGTNGSTNRAAVAPTSAEPANAPDLKTARKRPVRKPEEAQAASSPGEPSLGLELEDLPPAAAMAERIVTSDGATRLVVTAYIGIGNRLFIRGEGPGLTWEKGVPLQFVSIGRWRWETQEATGPVQFKLFKNDEVECAALGAQSLEPGHQQEVTASF